MKVLLVAHPYLNLYKIIVEELQLQGHDVVVIEESTLSGDPYYKKRNVIKRKYTIWKWKKDRILEKYWHDKCQNPIFNVKYDLLFVIQGCTFDVFLLNHLRKYNSQIKSSLYIWDTNRMYDFFRNIEYFDKVFSFDLKDVQSDNTGKVKFLPFFWPKYIENLDNEKIKYRISSIGTNHDGRFHIFKRIVEDLKKTNIPYYIKLIIKTSDHVSFRDKVKMINAKFRCRKNELEIYKLKYGKLNYDFIENDFYSMDDMCKIMAQSVSILDTDNELQFGTTPRLIWALALNKHIYTTNKNIVYFSFYNQEYIHLIDRKEPTIDWLLLSKSKMNSRSVVENLRIDKWVKNFL